MKHIIIGTAGHVDHGKTELVRALTGIDTDTLLEEKKRGITINNGYAYLNIDDENRVGIIDVPGHEKFMKNMVSGVSSIDIVLFIVAADEGIMPQTKEHLDILKVVGVKNAIVVLTKSDLVDDEWISFMKEEVRKFISASFMKDAPIIEISSKTGEGIEKLVATINQEIENVNQKDAGEIFRLPIDRVFTVNGFGTVVTGSIISGSIKVSDELEISSGNKVKVRGIEVHGSTRAIAFAGERCAINIVSDSKSAIERGMFLYEAKSQENSFMIDAKLELLNADIEVVNRQRVRVYHYSKEVMGRVVVLERESLKGGESGFVQLRLEEEISAKQGDRLVIRTYSPMTTIAGAKVLDANPKKAKRFKDDYIEGLKLKESGDLSLQIENILREKSCEFITIVDIANTLNISNDEILKNIEKLISTKKIIKVSEEIYTHNRYIMNITEKIEKLFNSFYKENPLKLGINKEAIKNRIIDKKIKLSIFDSILNILLERAVIEQIGNIYKFYGYEIKLTTQQEKIKSDILEMYDKNNFNAKKFDDFIKNDKNKKDYKDVLALLVQDRKLIYLEDDLYITINQYENALLFTKEFIKNNGGIALADLKQHIDTSRRYLVAFLEKLDREKITKRQEDKRILF